MADGKHIQWVQNYIGTHGNERMSELCDTGNTGMLVLFCGCDWHVASYLAIVRGHAALLLVVLKNIGVAVEQADKLDLHTGTCVSHS